MWRVAADREDDTSVNNTDNNAMIQLSMKASLRFIGAAGVAAALSTASLPAQNWQTVLDYQLAPGQGADGGGIVADALGNVFSGGNATDASGVQHGIVLGTDTTQLAGGPPVNWYQRDDSPTPPTLSQYYPAIWNLGIDPGGNVYSIGTLQPTSTLIRSSYWYIRKGSDSGLSWSTVDLFQFATGQWNDATGFAVDDKGNVYVAGWGRAAPTQTRKNQSSIGNLHWLVRRSPSGDSGTWSTVDDLESPTSGFGASAAGFVPGAGVFVVGGPFATSPGSIWMVRRSPTGGSTGDPQTWSTVDNPFSGAAQAVCGDTSGNVYVTGAQSLTVQVDRKTTRTYQVWTTRKSSNGDINTWSTVDTFTSAPNQSAIASGLSTYASGRVVAVGSARDAQGISHWIVRVPGSSRWETIDDFQLAPGYHASAQAVTTDAAGHLLVSGCAWDGTGLHRIVRKL
jgi:hypothetical protein